MRRHATILLALAACDPIQNRNIQHYMGLDGEAWDPAGLVATTEALYVPLPHAGQVARLRPGEPATFLQLGDGAVQRLQVAPDQQSVLALALLRRCSDHEGPREPLTVEDCDGELEASYELSVLRGDQVGAPIEIGAWYGPLTFSPDSAYAVAVIDPNAETTGGGIVNLTSMLVLDLATSQTWEVAVGFAADRVLFTADAAGVTTGAVVLSESEVAVVDLAGRASEPRVVFPLTLDPDVAITPVDVALTPSGEHAMISVQGLDDLYVLDLVNPSVNILSLSGTPSAMAVDAATDQTLVSFTSRAAIDLIEHDRFEAQTVPLDEAMSQIALSGDGVALLHAPRRSYDVYRVDLATQQVDEYRLNWLPQRVVIAPDFSLAVSMPNEANLEVLDLREGPEGVDPKPVRFGLDAPAVGVAFAFTETSSHLLVLQAEADTLYQLSWPDLGLTEVELPAPPLAIGSLPDGTFWITHDSALGLVSFYQPGEPIESVSGFGSYNLHSERLLAPVER